MTTINDKKRNIFPESNKQTSKNELNFTFPGFDLATARNDYGLLHLEFDFELSETIDTICLPKSPDTATEFIDDCYAAGWGKDSNGKRYMQREQGVH